MKTHFLIVASALLLLACEPASEPDSQVDNAISESKPVSDNSTSLEQPMPEKRPHEMTLHGHTPNR